MKKGKKSLICHHSNVCQCNLWGQGCSFQLWHSQEMVYFSVENQQPYSVSFLLSHLPFPPSSFLFSPFFELACNASFHHAPPRIIITSLELAAGGRGEGAGGWGEMKKQKLVNEWIQGCDCEWSQPWFEHPRGRSGMTCCTIWTFEAMGSAREELPRFPVWCRAKVRLQFILRRVNLMVSILQAKTLFSLPQHSLTGCFLFLYWMDLSCSLKGLNIPIIAKMTPTDFYSKPIPSPLPSP